MKNILHPLKKNVLINHLDYGLEVSIYEEGHMGDL